MYVLYRWQETPYYNKFLPILLHTKLPFGMGNQIQYFSLHIYIPSHLYSPKGQVEVYQCTQFAGMFRSHEIAATENFMEKPNNIWLDLKIEPKTSSIAVALRTRPTKFCIYVVRCTEMDIGYIIIPKKSTATEENNNNFLMIIDGAACLPNND